MNFWDTEPAKPVFDYDIQRKELIENIPSRSAKLRYVIKKRDFYDFETDVLKKFENLIKIENFGKKL